MKPSSADHSNTGLELRPLEAEPEDNDDVEDVPLDQGLLGSSKRKPMHTEEAYDWKRASWLGVGLFLALFAFWLLDSL